MNWEELGEFGFIEQWIRPRSRRRRQVIVGPGDDGAVWRSRKPQVITTDILVENVDFRLEWTSPRHLGRRLVSVNLSDLAAMGAKPWGFLISLAIPLTRVAPDFFDPFRKGVFEVLDRYQIDLLGGDISQSPKSLVLSGVALGEVVWKGSRGMLRSGARPGDLIFVTGRLGEAALGLELQRRGLLNEGPGFLSRLHDPDPPIETGLWLARNRFTTSMIDISDGFSVDLRHILEASRCGAEVRLEALPLSSRYKRICQKLSLSPWDLALSGGEDYELLFTVSPKDRRRVENRKGITWIGSVLSGSQGFKILDRDGKPYFVKKEGFDHFRSAL
ncbi:MAG: thiamine-phosphate kinase [Deltaproteobacteria bacterium]|nr:thiamine-phosphate kinase [Deltaproteobacteria bacterium]